METITNKFTSLLKSQSHPHRHSHGGNGELPIYQQLPNVSVRSASPSPSHRSISTEGPSHFRVHIARGSRPSNPQPTASHEFSSSSETLNYLGGPDIMVPISLSPTPPSSFKFSTRLPALKHFLSDFTLGFADGLTVPFALTAGLSSLGQTKTVIYAGMAEICAGSISMGIGGYLAAKGENAPEDDLESDTSSHDGRDDEAQEDEEKMPLHKLGNDDDSSEAKRIENYLSPLNLPSYLREQVLAHTRLSSSLSIPDTTLSNISTGTATSDDPTSLEPQPPSAILSGLSISLGYLLGGILPLFPYFFVDKVTDGLAWSFGVCVLALFFFGFGKAYALGGNTAPANRKGSRSAAAKWKRVRRSIWEGVQMVVLGSIAAGAAVVCVSAFERLA